MKCPKCGGEMEEGIITSKTNNGNFVTEWGTNISGLLGVSYPSLA